MPRSASSADAESNSACNGLRREWAGEVDRGSRRFESMLPIPEVLSGGGTSGGRPAVMVGGGVGLAGAGASAGAGAGAGIGVGVLERFDPRRDISGTPPVCQHKKYSQLVRSAK